MYPACEYSMRFAASALTWSGLPPDGLKGLHFGIAGREDVRSAMFREHGDLSGYLVATVSDADVLTTAGHNPHGNQDNAFRLW
jgi:hypothetical protein